jgi:hypothetical protein
MQQQRRRDRTKAHDDHNQSVQRVQQMEHIDLDLLSATAPDRGAGL